ncbi:NAD(P)-binding protein [Ephemerocybe angulata]|uniref:D-xylose 1-dehydrogenase (NADP(+), D-xylono-1,5-lactone-forming) n=1 Tax=Ephemerocybe angulata TaxID=980116 RepID=A0A8H6MG15_9AGAR|nr:NAD(P)-binding protein [Tulosesus angulatus]
MSSIAGFIGRVYKSLNPPSPPRVEQPLRFGILGAAAIAPNALIRPALSHPEVLVYAVAARDIQKAQTYATKHHIPKVHSNYEELLADKDIDVIYNPLPNGLHYEWTMKALEAGKHVLLEKPAANTAEEVRAMFDLAEKKGLVLLEAFHYRFHPAIQRLKAIVDSGELGKIKHVEATMSLPKGHFSADDIRYNYSLGGGCLMDMGCYPMNCVRYLTSSNPASILDVSHELFQPPNSPSDYASNVDKKTVASFAMPNDVTAKITCNFEDPPRLGFIPRLPVLNVAIECEGGKTDLYNFIGPSWFHTITVTPRSGRARKEKAYVFSGSDGVGGGQRGEVWWETYRYQLEAFVDRVKGREVRTWVDKEDSVANMDWIEKVYAVSGLGSRPKSTYVSTTQT